ncbi:hypothetical protein AHGSH82_014160 [Aeromonas hydrophila]|nr:hypothetical protein AO056_00583 [Aeromonas hydrophila]BBG84271.1 hypothetical protein AHGSH82_014160 [Aeromonas hydrophila]BBT61599.1 hypothetical protein WP8S18E02_13960 [Aeromonas hydrophila]
MDTQAFQQLLSFFPLLTSRQRRLAQQRLAGSQLPVLVTTGKAVDLHIESGKMGE